MTISTSITLDTEQQAALEDLRLAFNPELTAEEYLTQVLIGAIQGRVEANYKAALDRIGAAAKGLPFESRVALISQIESQLQP
jgi:hypothetical protein